ncbi:MAG TPA: Hpt domain-containing protein [Bacteroidota bacterium]|nr:Hpt domain-containing protein [Bacteroidota bacterium]
MTTPEEEYYRVLALDFLAHMKSHVASVVQTLPRCDWKEIETLGNHLKGSGTMFGFPHLSQLGAKLEEEVQKGRESEALATLLDLASVLERT